MMMCCRIKTASVPLGELIRPPRLGHPGDQLGRDPGVMMDDDSLPALQHTCFSLK